MNEKDALFTCLYHFLCFITNVTVIDYRKKISNDRFSKIEKSSFRFTTKVKQNRVFWVENKIEVFSEELDLHGQS